MNRYKTKVIETNKLKLKGEDISATIASLLEAELNEMAEKGWKIFSITPSLLTEGAVRKLILCFEKDD
jgi:hypothetical protein